MVTKSASIRLTSLIALVLTILGCLAAQAQEQSRSLSVLGGTLNYDLMYGTQSCGAAAIHPIQVTYFQYGAFSFTSGGVTYPISAYTEVYRPSGNLPCDTNGPVQLNLTFSPPGENCTIVFQATGSSSWPDSATGSCEETYTGYVNLKYLVVGVTYAPPGPSTSTFVSYQNSKLIGTTKSVSQSFTSSTTNSVSITYGLSIPLITKGSITGTLATTSGQTSKSTNSVTLNFQTQSGERTAGTANYFAPVNNDYDTIWIWLNPVAIFTTSANRMVWNGYGADTADLSGMDIVGVPLGYLNGDFGAMPPDYLASLNRTWDTPANYVYPAGYVAALTPADYAEIAKSDPFSVSTYGPDELGYNPPTPSTADGRFTMSACTSQASFDYVQGAPSQSPGIYTCTLTYTNTSTQTQENSTTNSETYTVDTAFAGTGFLSSFSAKISTANTLSFTTDWQSSITNTTTSTASLSVQGPPCGNATNSLVCNPVYDAAGNQPVSFDVYQDNTYGTFMFAPVHYY